MTSSPHDALFKATFGHPEHAAGLLRSVVAPELAEAADWTTLALEAGSFVDEGLADRHSDLLYSVELAGERAFVYVLLEHQSTVDPDMPVRVLEYMTRIWIRARQDHPARARRPILPVVVSHAPGGWTAATQFHQLFSPEPSRVPGLAKHVPAFELLLVDLAHLTNDQIKTTTMAAFPQLALWLLRDARSGPELLDNLAAWARAFNDAAEQEHGMAALAQLVRYIYLVTDGVQFERFRDMILTQAPRAETAVMTIAEQLREEGHKAGLLEGERRVLRGLLERKFGALNDDHVARLQHLDQAAIGFALDRVLTADSIDAVLA